MTQRNTPAGLFLSSSKAIKDIAKVGTHISIQTCIDDMCACISELENNAVEIGMNEYNLIYRG